MTSKHVAILVALSLLSSLSTLTCVADPPGSGTIVPAAEFTPPVAAAAAAPAAEGPAAAPGGPQANQPTQQVASQQQYQPWQPNSRTLGAQTTATSAGQYAGALQGNPTGAYNPSLVSGFNASNAAMLRANDALNQGFQNGLFDPNQFADAKAAQMAAYLLAKGSQTQPPQQTTSTNSSAQSGSQLKPGSGSGSIAANNSNLATTQNNGNSSVPSAVNNVQTQQTAPSDSQAQIQPVILGGGAAPTPTVTEDSTLGVPVNLVSVSSLASHGATQSSTSPAQPKSAVTKKGTSPGQAFFDSLNKQFTAEQRALEEAKIQADKSKQTDTQTNNVAGKKPGLTLIDDARRGDETDLADAEEREREAEISRDRHDSRTPSSYNPVSEYIGSHYPGIRSSIKELHDEFISRGEYQKDISVIKGLILFGMVLLLACVGAFFFLWMRKQSAIDEATADSRRLLKRRKLAVTASISPLSAKAAELLPTKVRKEIQSSTAGNIIQFPHYDKAKQRWNVVCLDQAKDAVLAALPIAAGSVMKMSRFANLKDVNVVFGNDGGLRPTSAEEKVGLHVKGALARQLGRLRFPTEKE
jgi:hypothetical protein